jgi:predicted DNA-binding transcriptional regulator AlpA
MNRQQALQAVPANTEQSDRRAHLPARRSYSASQIIHDLGISRSTFYEWKRLKLMPWLVELDTPTGRAVRYQAEPVDRFFENKRGTSRHFFGSHAVQSVVNQSVRLRPTFGHKGVPQ